ncbi:MAG: hypothetical protein JSS51_06710 [Planctomycetes bacterium]|nr:hypothetical protein [Planctomycetota bacterium]
MKRAHSPASEIDQPSPSRWSRWGKRAGMLAFLFFFVKGLAWLVVPVALAAWWSQ